MPSKQPTNGRGNRERKSSKRNCSTDFKDVNVTVNVDVNANFNVNAIKNYKKRCSTDFKDCNRNSLSVNTIKNDNKISFVINLHNNFLLFNS
jgi:hypothetical protein